MNMSKVKGCLHLIYDEKILNNTCVIAGMSNDRAVWERQSMAGLHLCQFCSLRGRLNSAEACTTESQARCGEFKMHEHTVICRDSVNEKD